MRVVLKSWTLPLDAEPGPALIELNLGTAGERTDLYAEITRARPVPSRRPSLTSLPLRRGLETVAVSRGLARGPCTTTDRAAAAMP